MWIYLKKDSILRCPSCEITVDMGGVEAYFSLSEFEDDKLDITCDCGFLFGFEELTQAGAHLVDKPSLRVALGFVQEGLFS